MENSSGVTLKLEFTHPSLVFVDGQLIKWCLLRLAKMLVLFLAVVMQ